MAEDTNDKGNKTEPEVEEIKIESIDGPVASVNKSRNQEKAVEFLSRSKTTNRLSASDILTTQLLVQDAEKQAKEGNSSKTIKQLTSYKAKKNLDYAILGILEKVAAGVPLVEGSVDDKAKGSDASVWETYKAKKDLILALIDNAPEDFKNNFKSTIDMVNRRLRPTNEQKPTVKLYKGDLKKGFVNSVIYSNFYASNSKGKKYIIRPWRKFKKNVRKLFEPSAATKLARLQRRNNRIKRKLWLKSLPGRFNAKRKELGGKIANWFKNNTKVGRTLVDLNKRRKEWWQKNKATVKKVVKYTGYAIGGAALVAGGALTFGAAPVAIAGAVAGAGYGSYKGSVWLYKNQIKPGYNKLKTNVKGSYDNVKKNINDKMTQSIENANKDQEKYAQRNPHPYKGKDAVYKMSEEDQKKIDMALNAYTSQARPTQEVEMKNGNIVTRKDTTKWVADDVERQASVEMLGKLIQPKDKGGMELPPEQAKEIMDFFQKQGLMKSTYDDIATDKTLMESVNKREEPEYVVIEEPTHTEQTGENGQVQNEEAKGTEQKPKTLDDVLEPINSSDKKEIINDLNTATNAQKLGIKIENYEEGFKQRMEEKGIKIPEETFAQIKKLNPDLFPKKEQKVETPTINKVNDEQGTTIANGQANVQTQVNDGQPVDITYSSEQKKTAKVVEMNNPQKGNAETRSPLNDLDTKTWNALLEASADMQKKYNRCIQAGRPQEAQKHLDRFERRLTSSEEKKGNFHLSKEQAETFKASQAKNFAPWKKQQISEGQPQSRTISFTKEDYAKG